MALSLKKISILFLAVFVTVLFVQAVGAGGAQPKSLDHTGITALKQTDPNLTGSGVTIAVICRSMTYLEGQPQNDYRPNIDHDSFKNCKFDFNDQPDIPAAISPHSTAICSILFGSDPNAYNKQLGQFNYQGIAPKAEAEVYELWSFLANNVFGQSPPDVDVISTSIGSQFEDWWTRGIESLIDRNGLVVVAGIGNGLESHDPPLYPAAGSNVIGVGVVDSIDSNNLALDLANFLLPYPEHSSMGPTDDNRCKPDIVAPGNCIAADANEPNRYEPTGNWSSFSTPVVAGTIGLLVQTAKADPNLQDALSPDGGNCVIKAILMNSAKKMPFWHKGKLSKDDDHQVPLDYLQGAGLLDAVSAHQHLTAGPNKPNGIPNLGWDLNQLDVNQPTANTYKLNIEEPNNKFITATLVWNRHYNDTYPFEAAEQNSNLRLELWAVDTNAPEKDRLLDYSDSPVDNVEHIYFPLDPNYTDYEIVATFSDIDDPNRSAERYALAWQIADAPSNNDILWYDLNTDGVVNNADITILLNTLKKTSQNYLGDINSDGAIDIKDLRELMEHQNQKATWYDTNAAK